MRESDPRITQVIEKHKDEILLNPEWMKDDTETFESDATTSSMASTDVDAERIDYEQLNTNKALWKTSN